MQLASRSLPIAVLVLLSCVGGVAQTDPKAQGLAALQASLAAQAGGGAVNDVKLTAQAEVISGSQQVTVTATLEATASGQSRVDLQLPAGTNSETRSAAGTPYGQWSVGDGVPHAIPAHNLLTDVSWFFPILTVQRALATPFVAASLGTGSVGNHIQIAQSQPAAVDANLFPIAKLSQEEIFIDPRSSLPIAFLFNTHPDNDANTDIAVEVLFSDYRAVNGFRVPFHVQKYINNSLVLDLQVQSAAINAGVPAADFAAQ